MNNYETIFLMKDDITEEQRNAVVDTIRQYLNENAKISNEEDIGKRKLAYDIRKYQYAYYYIIYFNGKASVIPELERNYRTNEDIIKHIAEGKAKTRIRIANHKIRRGATGYTFFIYNFPIQYYG